VVDDPQRAERARIADEALTDAEHLARQLASDAGVMLRRVREDSSEPRKSVWTPPWLPSTRARSYVCRMNNAHRVAIVTGASRGIGAGLVAGYRRLGFRVVATSRSIAPSDDEHVLAISGDIRDRATAQKVVAAGKERFGRVDTLVNNAGLFIAKPFIEYTQDDFDAVTATNVTGFFHMTRAVLAELLAQRSGHVVNITASLVDQPLASVPAGLAALTKGGLNALTKSLAIEVAKRGVRVNAVAPGLIKTPMHASGTHEFLAKLMPLGRMGEVQDIVDAVLYLESASLVTGVVLHVDGGAAAGVGGP
jgi:NAD(P)-dependent dehydrogenase (short-subunit alcohol dehydrogenase family)